MARESKLYAAAAALAALDFLLGVYAALRAPFPARVNLGSPTAYLNIYLHIPMAWASYLLYTGAFVSALAYLVRGGEKWDRLVQAFITVATVYAVFTLVSGMAWASESWGAAWSWDPRETAVLLLLLAYSVYFALRSSIPDPDRAATLSAAYAVAAYSMVPVSFLAPRLVESLHPTSSSFGNFMGRPEVMAIFGPKVLLSSITALLLAYLAAKRLEGAEAPGWARLVGLGFIAAGITAGLALAAPYLRGCVDRVVGVELTDTGLVKGVKLVAHGAVNLPKPVPSPVLVYTNGSASPVFSDGTPVLLNHLVCLSGGRIVVVRHWSVAWNLAAYAVIIGLVFLMLSRRPPSQPAEREG